MSNQTRLSISPEGQLVYRKSRSQPNYPYLQPATMSWPKLCHNDASILNAAALNSRVPILLLPDELLQSILHHAVNSTVEFSLGSWLYWESWDDDDQGNLRVGKGWYRYSVSYNIVLTCRRFHALAIPLLYKDISLDVSIHWLRCPPQERLFRETILRRPLLQNHIEHLAVKGRSLCSDIVRIACELPRIKTLSLEMARDESEISAIGPIQVSYPQEERFINSKVHALTQILQCQARMANFTKVHFYNLHARPQSIKRFLEWPKQLHEFVLNDMTYDGYSWSDVEPDPAYRWNHAILIDVLSPQKDHLRVLDLGWLGYDRDQNSFQVSHLSHLHTMALCCAYEFPDEQACKSWLTPSLRTLILDLHENDSQGGPVSHFREGHTKRLYEFAKMARDWSDRSDLGRVGLREIGVRVHARGDSGWYGEDEFYCKHNEYADKTLLLQCLRDVSKYGFEAFWVGPSDQRHTLGMVEAMCVCKSPQSTQ